MRQYLISIWFSFFLCLSLCTPLLMHAQEDFLPLPKNTDLDEALTDNRVENITEGESDFKKILMGTSKDEDKGLINPRTFNIAGAVVASMAVVFFVILGVQFFFSSGEEDKISKLKKEFANIILALFMISSAFFIGAQLMNPETATPGIEGQDAPTFDKFKEKFWQVIEWLPQIFAGVSLVMITLSGFNMVLRGQEDDVVQREKTFLKSFLIGFVIFLLGLAIAQIASFNDREAALAPNELDYATVIEEGFDRGDAILASKQGVEQIVGIISYILTYLSVAALIMLIISSLYFIINYGDEERANKAKRLITACAVGLIVAFSSYSLFQIFFVHR